MIRLHVVYHKVVGATIADACLYQFYLFACVGCLHAVDDGDPIFAAHHVGIVAHTIGQRPQPFKLRGGAVVDTYIMYLFGNIGPGHVIDVFYNEYPQRYPKSTL